MTSSNDPPPEPLLNAAVRLLAVRRRGVEELRDRLIRKGFSPAEVEPCLAWLEDRNLLNDQAFSQALVRDRIRFSPRSPALLRRELVRMGIAGETAAGAVDRILEEDGLCERDLAQEAGRRWATKQGLDALTRLTRKEPGAGRSRARRRLYGFLARKGFRGEAVGAGMEAAEMEARKILAQN